MTKMFAHSQLSRISFPSALATVSFNGNNNKKVRFLAVKQKRPKISFKIQLGSAHGVAKSAFTELFTFLVAKQMFAKLYCASIEKGASCTGFKVVKAKSSKN